MVDALFFFHNPKAGGTAVVDALQRLFASALACPRIENDAVEHTARGGRYDAFRGFGFYAGHYGHDIYRAVGQGMPAATNFRWPIERVVSVYRYFRYMVALTDEQMRDPRFRAVTLSKRLCLDDFVTCDDPAVTLHTHNHHFRQITGSGWSMTYEQDLAAARAIIDRLAWFYVCEHPYESAAWADEVFEGRLPAVRRLNVTQSPEPAETGLSAKAYRQLLAQNQKDMAMYQHALGRLVETVAIPALRRSA